MRSKAPQPDAGPSGSAAGPGHACPSSGSRTRSAGAAGGVDDEPSAGLATHEPALRSRRRVGGPGPTAAVSQEGSQVVEIGGQPEPRYPSSARDVDGVLEPVVGEPVGVVPEESIRGGSPPGTRPRGRGCRSSSMPRTRNMTVAGHPARPPSLAGRGQAIRSDVEALRCPSHPAQGRSHLVAESPVLGPQVGRGISSVGHNPPRLGHVPGICSTRASTPSNTWSRTPGSKVHRASVVGRRRSQLAGGPHRRASLEVVRRCAALGERRRRS